VSKDLVILAAGIGSRYGGLKQMEPVGPSGEFLIDYAVFDAIWAGFDRVVFVIRHDIEEAFRGTIGARIEAQRPVAYVYQDLSALPAGHTPPASRAKPWGTGHAIWMCRDVVTGPFAVINADDFYGRASFVELSRFLDDTAQDPHAYGMVGFVLKNTVSEHGTVSRAICEVGMNGNVQGLVEETRIEKAGDLIRCPGRTLTGQEHVSMNMWAFKPSLFPLLERGFEDFLKDHGSDPKAEFYIPTVVGQLVTQGIVRVRVLPTTSRWMGVTNPQDRSEVVQGIRSLVAAKEYPERLWPLGA